MSHRFNPHISPRIAELNRKLRAAKSGYRRGVREFQSLCSHEVVYQAPWTSSEWFQPQQPRRLCAACGYEEEVRYGGNKTGTWSWGGDVTERGCNRNTKPGSKAILGCAKFVIECTQQELTAKRAT